MAKAARKKARKTDVSGAAGLKPTRALKATPSVGGPRLLAGGNPQIAMAEGDAPVQAYITAMPGWKRALGVRLDAIIVRAVPDVRKSVKWNSPLYGVGPDRSLWFLSLRCFANDVKVTFFQGSSLRPLPPGTSTQKEVRSLNIRENEPLDEGIFADWVRQASRLPGVPL